MSILVTGATGNVGSRLVRGLTAAGHKVRAFTRSGEKAKFDGNVEVVTGDFKDKDSLRRALQGMKRMYLLSAASDVFIIVDTQMRYSVLGGSSEVIDKFEKRSIKLPANLFQVAPQPVQPVSPLAARVGTR